jgi:hypothetical protein
MTTCTSIDTHQRVGMALLLHYPYQISHIPSRRCPNRKSENRRSDFGRADRRIEASLNMVKSNETHDTRRGLPPLEGRLDS